MRSASRIMILCALCLYLLLLSPQPVQAETKIVINKGTNQLAFFKDGFLIDIFPVATGRQPHLTPEGRCKVVSKFVYPSWRNPKGGPVIPGGVPANPLGPRWLGLNARGTSGSSYGVHGNNDPASIGTYASSGCIRMRNEDILWLYERVPLGAGVEIISSRENLLNWKKVDSVNVNDVAVKFQPHLGPVFSGEAVYLPVRPVATALGYRLTWDENTRTLLLARIDREVLMAPGSRQIKINNKTAEIAEIPLLLENIIYLRDKYFESFLGATMNYHRDSRTLALFMPDDPSQGRLARYHMNILLNDKPLILPEYLTTLTDGEYLLVPAQYLCNAIGAAVNYNDSDKAVEISFPGKRISIPIDGSPALVDMQNSRTPSLIFVKDGSSYVNLHFLAEALGFKTDTDMQNRLIRILHQNTTVMFTNPFRYWHKEGSNGKRVTGGLANQTILH